MKKRWTEICYLCAFENWHKRLKKNRNPFDKIYIRFTWKEPNKRRDPDNIAAGKKYILDAMTKAGIIQNDGWKTVSGWQDRFEVSDKAGVRVDIFEVI